MTYNEPPTLRSVSPLLVALLAIAGLAGPAIGQEAVRADNLTIEEIIVTARKREESLRDIPVSVSAFTAEDLEDQTISDLTDLGNKVPNVVMSAVSSAGSVAPAFVVRGISSQSGGPGFPPGIGVYQDGVFLGRDRAFNMVLNDIEAVEILRGPQGTLYGKNTVAGAINIRTRKPTNEFEFNADATYGTDELFQVRGSVNIPIIEDRLMMRISGFSKDQDGFIRNTFTGDDHGEVDAQGGRVRLLIQPTDNLEIDLQADVFEQEDDYVLETQATILLPIPPYNTLETPNPNDRRVALNTTDYAERDLQGYSGRISYEFNGYDLTSITAYREYDSDFRDDSDGVVLDEFDVGREENFEHFTQEFRLTSPADDRFNWIVGLYYEEEELESFREIRLGPQFPTFILGLPPTPGEERGSTDAFIDSESWAIFGSVTLNITDTLELTTGLRYTDEEKDVLLMAAMAFKRVTFPLMTKFS
jgi:iron complex outermembrane receptor protein